MECGEILTPPADEPGGHSLEANYRVCLDKALTLIPKQEVLCPSLAQKKILNRPY